MIVARDLLLKTQFMCAHGTRVPSVVIPAHRLPSMILDLIRLLQIPYTSEECLPTGAVVGWSWVCGLPNQYAGP